MSVTIHTPGLDAIVDPVKQADRQEEYAMRVAFIMRQYVPMQEGILRASEQLSSLYRDGILRWTTPYAAAQYELDTDNRTTSGTNGHWDEPVRLNHMDDLKAYVAAMYRS